MAYFRKERHRTAKHLECYVEDPPIDDGEEAELEKHSLSIEKNELIRDYYQPVLNLLESMRPSEKGEAFEWYSRDFDFKISLDAEVLFNLERQDYKEIGSYLSDEYRHGDSLFGDGIKVEPGQRWLDLAKEGFVDNQSDFPYGYE